MYSFFFYVDTQKSFRSKEFLLSSMNEITFLPNSGIGYSLSVNSLSSHNLKFATLCDCFFTGVIPGVDAILFSVLFFDIGDML